MKLASGKYCAQFYAHKQSDGSWMLELDNNYPYPTWNEICGRAAVPVTQNTNAGGDLGRFTSEIQRCLHRVAQIRPAAGTTGGYPSLPEWRRTEHPGARFIVEAGMKIIASALLAGAALLTAALPASADDGPIDFGIFQGVNDTKGSRSTDLSPTWSRTNSDSSGTVPQSALAMLVDNLATPDQL